MIRMREGTLKRPRPAPALPILSSGRACQRDRPIPHQVRNSREDGRTRPATLPLDRGALGTWDRTRMYTPIRTRLSTSPGRPGKGSGQHAVSPLQGEAPRWSFWAGSRYPLAWVTIRFPGSHWWLSSPRGSKAWGGDSPAAVNYNGQGLQSEGFIRGANIRSQFTRLCSRGQT